MADWFPHDYDASSDPKLRRVRHELGNEGLGVYWQLVELLYRESGKYRLSEIYILADDFLTKKEVIASIIDIAFVKNGNYFFSKRILKNIHDRKMRSEIYRKNALKKGKNRKPAIAKQLLSNSSIKTLHDNSNVLKGGNALKSVPPNKKPKTISSALELRDAGFFLKEGDLSLLSAADRRVVLNLLSTKGGYYEQKG